MNEDQEREALHGAKTKWLREVLAANPLDAYTRGWMDRGAALAAQAAPAGAQDAWHATEIALARIEAEMSGINLTKTKDQTIDQADRLTVLRKQAAEIGQRRYVLAARQQESKR